MDLDAVTFRTIAKQLLPLHSTLSPAEAIAVVQIAELAVGIDLDEDPEEHALLQQVKRHVCAIGGISPADVPAVSPLPEPIDTEARHDWCWRLASQLITSGGRELAYVLAYLVIVGDLELAPVETSLIWDLQHALDISDDRAGFLVERAAEMVTAYSGPEDLPMQGEGAHRI